jgi:hypothetical protein
VFGGVERLVQWIDASHSETFERRNELLPHKGDALDE